MIATLQALGDRMLDRLLPKATAAAAVCPGNFRGCYGSCCYYCRFFALTHCEELRQCNGGACVHTCYDCCC